MPARITLGAALPLDSNHPNWQILRYDKIPANQISNTDAGLKISINGSASPLIHVLDQPVEISQISARGQLHGVPKIPANKRQGDKGADDFPFRLGLVLSGDKTLGFAEKLLAPQWVKTLFALAPKNNDAAGIDHIVFLNLASHPAPDWQQRTHPLGKGLMQEIIVAEAQTGEFTLSHHFDTPQKVLAFWFSIDGDDTDSAYEVILQSLEYE